MVGTKDPCRTEGECVCCTHVILARFGQIAVSFLDKGGQSERVNNPSETQETKRQKVENTQSDIAQIKMM